jgi:hypothetical protein
MCPARSEIPTELFNEKFRAEFLDRELFDTLLEAQILVECWRHEYNTFMPHTGLAIAYGTRGD